MANFINTMFISLDLEFEQPSEEILSVGACIFTGGGEFVERENFYITPSHPVSNFIQELTGIRETDFDGKPRKDCYIELSNWVANMIKVYPDYKFHREAITWGCGDVPALRADMRKEAVNFEWLSQRFIDVKTLYLMDKATSDKSLSSKTSLNTAMKEMKILPSGTAHNSMWDAVNTKEVFLELMYKQRSLKSAAKNLQKYL